jgi:lipoprotein-anchoring transpeptidase ErfK/SrfK
MGFGPATAPGRGVVASLRTALAAGVALAVLAATANSADAAGRRSTAYNLSEQRDVQAARSAFREQARGTLQIVVSIGQQHITLYNNGVRVARAPVSTGRSDHPTPTGVFSVIQKDRWHRSNLYDSAPMYFMQRLTWSGVAMHEGALPGVPASHGCIRLPREFAARMWGTTKIGVRVVVTHQDVVPQDFSHPALFVGKLPLEQRPLPKPDPRLEPKSLDNIVATNGRIELRSTIVLDTPPDEAPPKPVSIADAPPEAPAPLVEPADEPAPVKPASEAPKRGPHVAVLVSRKEKKIFVRQGFAPLFELPIEIAQPDAPLGTHVFTALELKDDGSVRWNVMSMPGGVARIADRPGKRADREVVDAAVPASSAEQALERIQMPQEAIERISEILVPGSSLIISDQGLGRETGRGTDFIVLTR